MAYDTHQEIDILDLEGHKLIAAKLQKNYPQILREAREGILEYGEPVTLAWQEWLDKFDQLTLDQLIVCMTQDNDEGQRIRQVACLLSFGIA